MSDVPKMSDIPDIPKMSDVPYVPKIPVPEPIKISVEAIGSGVIIIPNFELQSYMSYYILRHAVIRTLIANKHPDFLHTSNFHSVRLFLEHGGPELDLDRSIWPIEYIPPNSVITVSISKYARCERVGIDCSGIAKIWGGCGVPMCMTCYHGYCNRDYDLSYGGETGNLCNLSELINQIPGSTNETLEIDE